MFLNYYVCNLKNNSSRGIRILFVFHELIGNIFAIVDALKF